MKIEETWTYDAPADRVFAMLTDRAFQEAKCTATGALSSEIEIHDKSGVLVVETRREMSTEGLPDNVAKLVGKTLKLIETQLWTAAEDDGSRAANLEVALGGLPVTYVGRVLMTPEGDTTAMRVIGDLKARIPLFGGKVEQAAAPAIASGIRLEAQAGEKYLAEH